MRAGFAPTETDNQRLAEFLGRLGYPGFTCLRTRAPKKHPFKLLFIALAQKSLDARVAEALPWVALQYAQADSSLVQNARRFNLQNRLGCVVSLARRVADRQGDDARSKKLHELEDLLDESRLAKEGAFYRPTHTESEWEWLRKNRTEDAMHWNLLTDMRPEHLQYASQEENICGRELGGTNQKGRYFAVLRRWSCSNAEAIRSCSFLPIPMVVASFLHMATALPTSFTMDFARVLLSLK
jgi:hypothetical protein